MSNPCGKINIIPRKTPSRHETYRSASPFPNATARELQQLNTACSRYNNVVQAEQTIMKTNYYQTNCLNEKQYSYKENQPCIIQTQYDQVDNSHAYKSKDHNRQHPQIQNDRGGSIGRKTPEIDIIQRKYEVLLLERNQLEEQLNYFKNIGYQTETIYYSEFQQAKQQCDEWRHKCQDLEMSLRQASCESQQLVKETISQVTILTLEIERLNLINNQIIVESDNLNQQLRELCGYENDSKLKEHQIQQKDRDIQSLQAQLQQNKGTNHDQMTHELILRGNQINTLRDRCAVLEAEARIAEGKVGGEDNDITIKNTQLITEQDRLQQCLRQRNDERQKLLFQQDGLLAEIERLNMAAAYKNEQIEEYLSNQKSSLSIPEMERLNKQISMLKEGKQNDSQEIERQKTILRSFELRIKEYEHILIQAQLENQRISAVLSMQEQENKKLKIMIANQIYDEVDTWKGKFCELNRDYHLLQEHVQMVKAEAQAKKSSNYYKKEATKQSEAFSDMVSDPHFKSSGFH